MSVSSLKNLTGKVLLDFPKDKRVLIVSGRLPLNISKDEAGGWKFTEEKLFRGKPDPYRDICKQQGLQFLWLGLPMVEVTSEADQESLKKALEKHSCVPLFLTSAEDKETLFKYEKFCKNILWQLVNTQQVPKFSSTLWEGFVKMTDIFGEFVKKHYKPGDRLFVHGFNLSILPAKIRKLVPDEPPIGFFLYSPFPTTEIFRTLPVRDQLLQGMLGADLIGFQTYHYCRHFISACTHVLGLDSDWTGVETDGHHTNVCIFPVGIYPSAILSFTNREEVLQRCWKIKESHRGKKIIVDKAELNRICGVTQKLLAFEHFLQRYPEWKNKVVLIQVCVPPPPQDIEKEEYDKLCKEVNTHAGRINGKYATIDWQPIHLLHKDLSEQEIGALYRAADMSIITPIRDTMNLAPHEFTACQQYCTPPSPLIISEFTGTALSLGGTFAVNPFNKKKFSSLINSVLKLGDSEKTVRHQHNFNFISAHTGPAWARVFLTELYQVTNQQVSTKIEPLDENEVKQAFIKCNKRVLLLDYDGTLSPLVSKPELAVPSPGLLASLEKLSADPKNDIYVISGRDKITLEGWLGKLPIALCCEHGLFFRTKCQNSWHSLLDPTQAELAWKDAVLNLMEHFTERTPGSFVEKKQINLVWHYRNVEADYGNFQAKDLVLNLLALATKLPMEILKGKKVVEVRPVGCNKGSMVRKIMHEYGYESSGKQTVHGPQLVWAPQNSETTPPFVLCIGDDKTDEDMFAVLSDAQNPFSVRVTKAENSYARYFVDDVPHVLHLLETLASS